MTYFNIHIRPNQFSAEESPQKIKKRHNALDTLLKIERVFKENLTCDPTSNPLTSQQDLLDRAKQICDQYVDKQSKLSWIWRIIFSKKKALEATFERIVSLSTPPLPVSEEVAEHVLSFLNGNKLGRYSQVSHWANRQAVMAQISLARKYGYEGNDIDEAKNYIYGLRQEIHFLSKKEWKIAPHTIFSLKPLIVYKRKELHFKQSWQNLMQMSIDDVAKLYIQESCPGLCRELLRANLSTSDQFTDQASADFALMIAIRRQDAQAAQFFLSHGANPDFTFGNKISMVSLSINRKAPEITKLLLEAGADIRQTSVSGHSLFEQILRTPDNVELLKCLIEYGFDVNQPVRDGLTALHVAAELGNLQMVELLIEHGAIIDVTNSEGDTPLLLSIASPKIVELLLRNGANVNHANAKGRTALHYAMIVTLPILADKLSQSAEILKKYGANLDLKDKDGLTLSEYGNRASG
ncbi:MAG: ankyrin repeat domain-containing protein [Parachlamydiaceae bacterium]